MLKKMLGLFPLLTVYATTNAASTTLSPKDAPIIESLDKLHKFKAKTVNEIEYWWVLHNDGCYHLYRVEIVGGILEFWTPLGYWNYIGTTTNCVYSQEQMEVMC